MGSRHLWFIIFEVGLYSTIVLAAPPVLTISSPTDHLRQGSTVILTCTIFNLDSDYFSEVSEFYHTYRNSFILPPLSLTAFAFHKITTNSAFLFQTRVKFYENIESALNKTALKNSLK